MLVTWIPLGLRGLLLPLPFYFIFTLNWRITVLVLITGVISWFFYGSLARFLRLVLTPLPGALQIPIMRYWPVVLYTYLLTRRAVPTSIMAIGILGFQLFDAWMESYFAPVWAYQRSLAPPINKGIFLTRLALGISAPFVLAYSWGLFNPLMDHYTSLFAAVIFLVTYFVMRGPRTAVQTLILGTLLGLGVTEFAWADNCSGGVDCYNTVGFNSAALVALFGGLGAVGLSLTLDFLPVVGELKSFYEFKTGKDLITGEKLPWWARLLALLGAIPIIGRLFKLGKFAKSADKLGDIARALEKTGDLARGADDLGDLARVGDKTADAARAAARGGELSSAAKSADRIRDLAAGTKATPADFGIPARNERGIQNVAELYDANIAIRPTNPESLKLIQQGYPPKPMDIKSKTINELDTMIGADANDIGKVGYFHPRDMTQQELLSLPPDAQKRYWDRIEEFMEYQPHMDELSQQGLIKLENGVVINTGLNPNAEVIGKAFAGDHDVFKITDRYGGELPDAIKEQITRDLKEYGVEHGPHVDWRETQLYSQEYMEMYYNIIKRHIPGAAGGGGEPLIIFGPGLDPFVVYF